MDKALQERIERAHVMQQAGTSTKTIAAEFGVTDRTIRRWLSYELDPATMEKIELDSRADREQFRDSVWRSIHKIVVQIEEMLDNREFKARDLAVTLGILVDKLRLMCPPTIGGEEVTTTGKLVEFHFDSPQEVEQKGAAAAMEMLTAVMDRLGVEESVGQQVLQAVVEERDRALRERIRAQDVTVMDSPQMDSDTD